ncbi:MAG: hypothetical protein K2W99_08590, partial [Chthoniobacterales bacterium]|nr:hypothetical protein [Chthoniobacterales bacterium]
KSLNDLETATKEFQEPCAKLSRNDVDDPDVFKSNNAEITAGSNAIVANGRATVAMKKAQQSTAKAVADPGDATKQAQATKDIQAARDAANQKGVSAANKEAITKGADHCEKAMQYGQYKEKGLLAKKGEDFKTLYNKNNKPQNLDRPVPQLTPEGAANRELNKANLQVDASAEQVQTSIAATTKPLAESRAAIQQGLRTSSTKVTAASAKTSESARCYNDPEARKQTKTVNDETQNLALAAEKYKKNPTGENYNALCKQNLKTKQVIKENPDAHAEVITQANMSTKTTDTVEDYYNKSKGTVDLNRIEEISEPAKSSQSVASSVQSRQATGKSGAYYNNFQVLFSLFAAISSFNTAGGQILQAQGQAQKAAMDQASQTEQAAATSYGYGEQASQSNAQLQAQTLQSLESTYQSISQSQTQDVQFVRGAN